MCDQIIPYIIERENYIWDIGLKKITGVDTEGNNSKEIIYFWKMCN